MVFNQRKTILHKDIPIRSKQESYNDYTKCLDLVQSEQLICEDNIEHKSRIRCFATKNHK